MPDFGIFRGFGEKLVQGQTPSQLGLLFSLDLNPLLLDVYTNAAVAYSLRKLRKAYNGSAIRVRRSSDNTEQDIGFTGSNVLDTSALTTFCGSGNGFVTTWYDQSLNGINATQTTAVSQPQIISSGSVLTLNQNAAINFNGSNFYRSSNGVLNTPIIDAFTLFSEEQLTSGQVVFALPQATTHTSPFARLWLFLSTTETQVRQNGVSYAGAALTASTQYLFNVNNKNAIVYRNENIYISGKPTDDITYPNSVPFMIGANANNGEGFIGKFQEIIIYSTNQTSNRSAISSNINTFYAIY